MRREPLIDSVWGQGSRHLRSHDRLVVIEELLLLQLVFLTVNEGQDKVVELIGYFPAKFLQYAISANTDMFFLQEHLLLYAHAKHRVGVKNINALGPLQMYDFVL